METRRRMRHRPKYLEYQGQFAVLTILLSLCLFTYLYYNASAQISFNWLTGIIIGFVLDKSRLCFNAALRDPFLYGLSRTTKGVLAALLVSSLGFGVIQYVEWTQNSYIPGNLYPVGWNILIGAIIFGIGSAIAGSCCSGSLMRIGEGFTQQMLVLIGLVLGSIHGMHDAPWWYKNFSFKRPVIHIPTELGWIPGILVQVIVILLIYKGVSWYEDRRLGGDE